MTCWGNKCLTDSLRFRYFAAETVGSSIVFELCGTFAEVYTADVLLQGKTNLDEFLTSMSWCLGLCGSASTKAGNKVHSETPEPAETTEKDEGRRVRRSTYRATSLTSQTSSIKRKAHQRAVFCGTAMIINTITEASGLVVASLFWIGCNANPSQADGDSIEVSQAMINLAIMLFGELVISDSAVAYISHKFESRYIISIAHEWEGLRDTQRRAVKGIVVIVCLISSGVIMQIPNTLCLTSDMPAEEDWALTQCPEVENRTTTNVMRVDDMYKTPWGRG